MSRFHGRLHHTLFRTPGSAESAGACVTLSGNSDAGHRLIAGNQRRVPRRLCGHRVQWISCSSANVVWRCHLGLQRQMALRRLRRCRVRRWGNVSSGGSISTTGIAVHIEPATCCCSPPAAKTWLRRQGFEWVSTGTDPESGPFQKNISTHIQSLAA